MFRVVVQVSDIDSVDQAITSCNNLINEMPDAEVEVVFHQSAINAVVKGSRVEERIKELMRRGVTVVACRNSMRSRNITEDQLIEGVKIVNAGVAEIVRRQAEGWYYLKL
ncbi:DsrE family protein [Vulcanisaeta sp. JCM 14467]|uniref:DsrE family protein n=1 Tax=Vulcanisaeta sp. JCM 14467 TaxID=1295370 RepID=UPI0006D16751|nr:DsrH/TusB family sulfur metabolism protein [Vulcanisaeta sp. JCM 14467]